MFRIVAENQGDEKRPLSLGGRPGGKLELRKPIETGSVRQSFPHGRSKTVQVEVRKKRGGGPTLGERIEAVQAKDAAAAKSAAAPVPAKAAPAAPSAPRRGVVLPQGLTPEERASAMGALLGRQALRQHHA